MNDLDDRLTHGLALLAREVDTTPPALEDTSMPPGHRRWVWGVGAAALALAGIGFGLAVVGSDDVDAPVAQLSGSADTVAPTTELTSPPWTLVPPRDTLRSFPSNDELTASAASIPQDMRMIAGVDVGWVDMREAAWGSYPVYSLDDDSVVGIAVAGIGVIPRDTYDTPSIDLEAVAREKWGDDYDWHVQVANDPDAALEGG